MNPPPQPPLPVGPRHPKS